MARVVLLMPRPRNKPAPPSRAPPKPPHMESESEDDWLKILLPNAHERVVSKRSSRYHLPYEKPPMPKFYFYTLPEAIFYALTNTFKIFSTFANVANKVNQRTYIFNEVVPFHGNFEYTGKTFVAFSRYDVHGDSTFSHKMDTWQSRLDVNADIGSIYEVEIKANRNENYDPVITRVWPILHVTNRNNFTLDAGDT